MCAARTLAVVLAVLSATAVAARGATGLSRPQALQQCVDRWNWMNYRGGFSPERNVVPVKVQAHPCRIEIAYRFKKSDPAYKHYLSTYFPCHVNRFGAFVCPEHAYGIPDGPPRTGFNARWNPRVGVMRLSNPPAHRIPAAKPAWIRQYPVELGFIVPFDRDGRLRSGLSLVGRPHRACTTYADIRERSTLYGCGAGYYCFAPSLPPRNHQRLACPRDRGSRVFERGVLTVLRAP
jgi:hypothetical protein